jgi:NitT/TauT family transport system substrate-binding protein
MKLYCLYLAAGLAIAAAGLSAQGATQPLRFGTLPAESAIPLIIAAERGLFAQAGAAVELVPFNSPIDRNIALQGGKLDGMIGDVMTALVLNEAGLPMRITSDINEDFKLLCSPKSGVKTFAQLDGKDVSVVPNFALEYVMDRFAAKNGIKWKLVNIPSIPARFEALLSGQITGVVFTEPQATLLAARGASVLAGSRDYGLKVGAILFTEKAVRERAAELAAFYRAYDLAVDYIGRTPAADFAALLTKYGFPEAVKDYLAVPGRYSHAAAIGEADFAAVLDWSLAKGLVKKTATLSGVASQLWVKPAR